MAAVHPFFQYTSQVLAWRLGRPEPAAAAPRPSPEQTQARARRILRAAANRKGVVLAGLGSGELAATLAASLPENLPLAVLSLSPQAARERLEAGALAWLRPDGTRQLVADTSATALFCLLAAAGWYGDAFLAAANPEGAGPDERQGLETWRRLWTGSRPAPDPDPMGMPAARPTLAVLARPDEPDLAGFFAAVSGLAGRAVIVWDAGDVPGAARQAEVLGVPITHLARPLEKDFAAQRNALLAACPASGWVLSLDPDERPGPGFGAAIDRIMATPGLGGAYFPRLTLFPDPGRAKVGYGLWPDLQLRLFRTHAPARPRYVRPVHERLEGLAGLAALALDAPLVHLNRLLAGDAAVTAKLAGFDAAAGGLVHHCLSRDYPTLPVEFFAPPPGAPDSGRVLLLPPMW